MELTKLKIIKKESSNFTQTKKVFDIEVEDAHHYILDNGVISHNSGPWYNASTVITLSTAQLKDGQDAKTKTGVIVTSKIRKSRFTKAGIPIKFHISFYKGMNPYVGLEDYVDWETCGIGAGKFDKSGEFIPSDGSIRGYAVKHLNKVVKKNELWNSSVFTQEVLEKLDEKFKSIFSLPDVNSLNYDELDELMEEDEESENTLILS